MKLDIDLNTLSLNEVELVVKLAKKKVINNNVIKEKKVNISNNRRNDKWWSATEINTLKEAYNNMKTMSRKQARSYFHSLVRELGRTHVAVYAKMHRVIKGDEI